MTINFHIPSQVFWFAGGFVAACIVLRVLVAILVGNAIGRIFGWR